jgi:glycosyltransferase involved in cell wall biosynthesis
MTPNPQKICFIMQEATPGTHMDYVYEMARTLREDEGLSLTLLLEKGSKEARPAWVVSQQCKWAPLRVLENLFLIARERVRGTKVFYIHYSFLSAITAGLVTKISGGRVFYWNAGMPWQYTRPWYTDLYQKFAYAMIDVLVTGAESLRQGYMQTYGLQSKQIIIIPNWIDLKKVTPTADKSALKKTLGIPDDVPLLLFVHKVVERKGAQWLVPLLEQMNDKTCHLVIAGDGAKVESIKERVRALGIEKRVHVLGRVHREVVTQLYQVADVFVMPSEEEGSPHSLIEAMAYGVPSVSFAVGGILDTLPPELASYAPVYGDTAAFAHCVDGLLSDSEEYHRVSLALQHFVQRYDKPKIVARFVQLFR